MLYGTVDYDLKDGRQNSVDWAAHAHLVKEGDAVKMDFYQVYLVSSFQMLSFLKAPSFRVSVSRKGRHLCSTISKSFQTSCRVKEPLEAG